MLPEATLSKEFKPEGGRRLQAMRWEFSHQSYRKEILENYMSECARRVCIKAGVDYDALPIRERLQLTRIRCTKCGMRPLYMLDLQHLNKVKCMTCSHIVNLKNKGKYGRIRKQIALESFEMLRSELRSV